MTYFDCSHNCDKCPSLTLGGNTRCMILNKILKAMDYEIQTAKQLHENARKEGEN